MKISAKTQAILKNYASINDGKMFIDAGNVLWMKNSPLVASAVVEEDFPVDFTISNLTNFLNVLSLFNNPVLEFTSEYLRITEEDGTAETLYGYAGIGIVTSAKPSKVFPFKGDLIEFDLTEDQWTKIQKATSILTKPELKIASDGTTIRFGTDNHKQSQGNSFSLVVPGSTNGFSCNVLLDKDKVNLLKGSYHVSLYHSQHITETKASQHNIMVVFKNTSGYDLTYYVGANVAGTNWWVDSETNTATSL